MSYPKQLVRLRPIGGVVHDIAAAEVGPNHYTAGRNVRFANGFAERIRGEREVYAGALAPPLDLVNAVIGGINYWAYVSVDGQYVVETSNHSDVTITGGLQPVDRPHFHSLALLNGVVVHNNGRDAPMYWPGTPTDEFEALPGWPAGTIAARLVPHKYHLFALNLDTSGGLRPMQLLWSDAAEPGAVPSTWAPAAGNQAGDVELSDTPGGLVTAASLRDTLLIYKRSAIYAADYVGGNNVYNFRLALNGIGALCPKAVAVTERGHIFVTDGDIMLTDGNQAQSIADARVRRYLFDQIDQERFEDLYCIYHRAAREVLICFPQAGTQYGTLALIYSLDADAWGMRDQGGAAAAAVGVVNDTAISDAWDDDSESWDSDLTIWNQQRFSTDERLLVAETAAERFTMYNTSDAVARDAAISKHDMTFDQAERIKFLRRIHLRQTTTGASLLVRTGARMTLGDPIAWGPEVTVPHDRQIVNVRALGRYISIEIRSTGAHVWRVPGFDLEVEMRGYH